MSAFAAFPRISPFLWFDNNAEEAVAFYISVFKNSRILGELKSTEVGPLPAGETLTISFELDGQQFTALNSGSNNIKFNESISLVVRCDTQEEVDEYWEKLISDGGEPGQCGWLKDKFGVSWQITPAIIYDLVSSPRGMAAMMQMTKLDIEALERAAAEER
jgi:predicted 3-demethylubiquinone-9 3-methyltransferase (glyoxalase superfamily)